MMKKIFVLILISLNTLILNANINSILNQNKTYEIYKADYKEKTFNAVRYINNNYSKEQIKAKNIYSTSSIDVYLENGLTVDEKILKEILSQTMKAYELEKYLYGDIKTKLILLIMDINGGHTGAKPYMQGYSIFEGNYSEIENENKNIIFLDYINGWDNVDSVLNTIIHELQHIIHYSNLRESKKTA